jgi:hypothetical protein
MRRLVAFQPDRRRDVEQQLYIGWEIIAVLSLPPLLVGLLVWWLAMGRKAPNVDV